MVKKKLERLFDKDAVRNTSLGEYFIQSTTPDNPDDELVRIQYQTNDQIGELVEALYEYWPIELVFTSHKYQEFTPDSLMTELINNAYVNLLPVWKQGQHTYGGDRHIELLDVTATHTPTTPVDPYFTFYTSFQVTKPTAEKFQELCDWFPDDAMDQSPLANGKINDPKNAMMQLLIYTLYLQNIEHWEKIRNSRQIVAINDEEQTFRRTTSTNRRVGNLI